MYFVLTWKVAGVVAKRTAATYTPLINKYYDIKIMKRTNKSRNERKKTITDMISACKTILRKFILVKIVLYPYI